MKRAMIVAVALVLVILPGATLAKPPAEVPSLSSALHLLPPLGDAQGKSDRFDQSLIDFLTVTICRVEGSGCATVQEYTSQKDKRGLDYIKLQNHQYHFNWDVDKNQAGKEFEIHFAVAGLEIGSVSYTPGKGKTVPVKFCIDNHPRIRCRVLHEQGYSAPEIATVLKDEFDLGPRDTAQILADDGFPASEVGLALKEVFDLDATGVAQILKDLNFSAVEVGTALRDVFSLDASGAAQILKDVGFPAVEVGTALRDVFSLDASSAAQILKGLDYTVIEIYEVLTDVYGLSDIQVENILHALGFRQEEFLWITAGKYVKLHAPVLGFDFEAKTFPMDAQKWFEEMLCGVGVDAEDYDPPSGREHLGCQKKDVGWGNNDIYNLWEGDSEFSTLDEYNYKVPTYYKIRRCDWTTGQLRIEYRWFYGWQPRCDCCSGSHPADWEHITVITSEDRWSIAAITYYQHSGWYTRNGGRWKTKAGHPVVYVGKTSHGSYHDDGGTGTCLYWEDWRNPVHDDDFWRTWGTPLINLDFDIQGWMKFDRLVVGGWAWGYDGEERIRGPVTTSELCGIRACKGKNLKTSGCWFGKSNCLVGHCWCGDSRCSHDCWSCVAWEEYQNNYWIPTSDSGFYGTSQ